jgi:hypothetical protein
MTEEGVKTCGCGTWVKRLGIFFSHGFGQDQTQNWHSVGSWHLDKKPW